VNGGFLLDTNIPSELTRPSPDDRVKAWVDAQDQSSLHMSVISVGELRKGISLLAPGKRRTQLELWFENFLLPLFGTRILPVAREVADCWGVLSAERQLQGVPLNTADGLIAATVIQSRLTLVTRNVKDFAGVGAAVLNPWEIRL
jgi:predicted nucleic acid-binding protein